MGITVLCASVYMWYKKTEHFPFGMREVRPLLVARGLFGFFGVFGMYCKSISSLVDVVLVVFAPRIEVSRERVVRSTKYCNRLIT